MDKDTPALQFQSAYFAPNWFGDSIMAWGALERAISKREAPSVLIAKERLAELWTYLLHGSKTQLITYPDSLSGLLELASTLRSLKTSDVWLLTETPRNYFGSYLSRANRRVGWKRGLASNLLTDVREKNTELHRSAQYAQLLLSNYKSTEVFFGTIPPATTLSADVATMLSERRCIALFPGAARGPSKRWPHFPALAELLVSRGYLPLVVGSKGDLPIAATISAGENLCGRLSIAELATVVSSCVGAVSNDSGGMHLVDFVGTPLVAVFGNTDPSKTGPRRASSLVLKAGALSSVKIARSDLEAELALKSIMPEEVLASLLSAVK